MRAAHFDNFEKFDPGVRSAKVAEDSPTPYGLGAKYSLVTLFQGKESDMTYETTDFMPPQRVVLKGEGGTARATDKIEFAPSEKGGTEITYTADIVLKWPWKLGTPFVRGSLHKLADDAISGMKEAFAKNAHKQQ